MRLPLKVCVDGLPEEVSEGTTVLDVLENRSEPTNHIIVEINGSFVHPTDYGSKRLCNGDRMEIIYPAFGG